MLYGRHFGIATECSFVRARCFDVESTILNNATGLLPHEMLTHGGIVEAMLNVRCEM